MTQKSNPGTLKKELVELNHGLTTSPPGGQASLVVAGTPALVSELVTELSGYAAAFQAVDAAEEKYKIALAARDAIEAQATTRRKQIRAAVKGVLGSANPALLKYGMTPDKPRHALNAAEVTEMVAKAKAKRAARHTMGKKQKLAIKGQVPPPASPPQAG